MRVKHKQHTSAMEIIAYIVVTAVALMCIVPFIYIISISLTAQDVYVPYAFKIIPDKVSLENYAYVLKNSAFVTALKNTIFVTVVGTICCLP